MATITGLNGGGLKEILADALVNLRSKAGYLTSELKDGSKVKFRMANNRGFKVAVDYTRNNGFGYMNPDGGNLTSTMSPALDTITGNLQYVQFGQEISNLQLANSAGGSRVAGADAKALATRKVLERRAEVEEFYFCRGDGYQTIGDITGSASTTLNTEGTIALAGTRDGLGAFMLGPGQKVRVYSAAYAFKHKGTITSKTSNTAVGYTPSAITTTGVVDTDLIFPDSDVTTPTTAGIKGLPYLVKNSGSYFDKTLSSTPAFKAVIDSSTTTPSRTTFEALYRNSQTRCGTSVKQVSVTSGAQMSNYYAQFYTQNTAQVHVVGNQRAGIDLGASGSPDDYTFWGQPIKVYRFIHPKNWWMLNFASFVRLTLKDAGPMLVPQGDYVPKISSGEFANAMQRWDDDYLEYFSPTPHLNGGFTGFTFSGLPGLLKDSPETGA